MGLTRCLEGKRPRSRQAESYSDSHTSPFAVPETRGWPESSRIIFIYPLQYHDRVRAPVGPLWFCFEACQFRLASTRSCSKAPQSTLTLATTLVSQKTARYAIILVRDHPSCSSSFIGLVVPDVWRNVADVDRHARPRFTLISSRRTL